jgi:ATP-dependent helicase/DNAse subunit B
MKENNPNNLFFAAEPSSKQEAYARAQKYWTIHNIEKAEAWALRAMKLGSKTLAPQLLADIANSTRSKSMAITLASYHWDHKAIEKALHWANRAKEFGSIVLADALILKINTHQNALQVQDEFLEDFGP